MTSMNITVFLLEDNSDDFVIIRNMFVELQSDALRPVGYSLKRAATLKEALGYLDGGQACDVILYDLNLPDSRGQETITRMSAYAATKPSIVLTGLKDDTLALESLKHGGQDYLVKSDINPMLLHRSIGYAIERFKIIKERDKLIVGLQQALDEIKTLRGMIPICANCKRIRDDRGYWEKLEQYLLEHSYAQFSHGICPECAKLIYGVDVSTIPSSIMT